MNRKILVFLGFLIIFLILIPGLNIVESDSNKNSIDVIISENGYFTSDDIYLNSGDKLKVEVEVNIGGPIDVYLMTESQYELAYNLYNMSPISISYLKGIENSKSILFTYESIDYANTNDPYYYWDVIRIVIDNRNCSLTNNDADATGKVEASFTYTIDVAQIDPIEDIAFVCVGVAIIIVVIIIIVIFYFVRESRRKPVQTTIMQQVPIQPTPPVPTPQPQYNYPYPQQQYQTPQYTQPYQYYSYPNYYQYQQPAWPPYGPPPQQQPMQQPHPVPTPMPERRSISKTKRTTAKGAKNIKRTV